MSVLIRQATLIDAASPFNGQPVDISIDDTGHIDRIAVAIDGRGDDDSRYTTIIGGRVQPGLCVSAGWVDVFADYREPGFEQKETIATGLNAAAAGGFTDVLLVPNTEPVTDSKSGIQYALQRAQHHVVRLHPLGAITQEIAGKSLAEMLDMRSYGALAFTDGWKPVQNTGLMLKALEYVKAFDGTVLQIPVDATLAAGGLMHEGKISTRLGMPGIPILAETLLVHRDIELAKYTGGRLHITGVSTAESVALIRNAKAEGVRVSCSVTPYHLALNDEALVSYNSLYKVSPPLRPEADRKALIAALKDGTVDCIATHHRPQDWDAKAKEFEYAGDGIALQEIAFPVLWTAISSEVSLERLVAALTTGPRKIFNLADAILNENNPASLTIFMPGTAARFEGNKYSLAANNPFAGKDLTGTVIGIINQNKSFIYGN